MSEAVSHGANIAKPLLDAVAITVTVGAFVEILPALAAIASLVWTLIRIWETATVQKLRRRFFSVRK